MQQSPAAQGRATIRHETARVHRPFRRHDSRMAARGACPATNDAVATKEATATIPIVFAVASDPVEFGLVASLNRPGGNLTGTTTLTLEVASKWLELLHELMPTTSTFALLINPTSPALAEIQSLDLQAAARKLELQVHLLEASTDRDFDTAFARLVQLRSVGS